MSEKPLLHPVGCNKTFSTFTRHCTFKQTKI